MNTRTRRSVIAAASLLAGSAHAQTRLVLLGDFPGIDRPNSYADAVSRDGSIVFGLSIPLDFVSVDRLFVWTEEDGLGAAPPFGDIFRYNPQTASPNGRYLVGDLGVYQGVGAVGFVWSPGGPVVPAGVLDIGSGFSYLSGVNDSGLAVGQAAVGRTANDLADLFAPVMWTAQAGLERLPLPEPGDAAEQSRAGNPLEDGRVQIVAASGSWLYDPAAGGFEMLAEPGVLLGMNPDGSFAAGRRLVEPGRFRAVVWTGAEGVTDLPEVPMETAFPGSRVFGASDDGRVILGSNYGEFSLWFDRQAPVPFREYAANRGINLEGIRLFSPSDISGDGRVFVGVLQTPEPGNQGFVLTIEPCPADASFDGLLTPEDFFAWVSAYQTGHIRCDQNGDGLCTGADFFAWVVGYAQGCP